ncbi:hypothetical protein EIP86_004855 [Pleurotus ostreatoroseus]|nr:hypothetical protein EIP86_004855 [Pleurotus ostreatoroseus]
MSNDHMAWFMRFTIAVNAVDNILLSIPSEERTAEQRAQLQVIKQFRQWVTCSTGSEKPQMTLAEEEMLMNLFEITSAAGFRSNDGITASMPNIHIGGVPNGVSPPILTQNQVLAHMYGIATPLQRDAEPRVQSSSSPCVASTSGEGDIVPDRMNGEKAPAGEC